MTTEQTRLSSALRRFKELHGDGEVRAMRAPARINIIGEHVDYVPDRSMASLAFASREHAMLMLFRASDEGVVRGASTLEKFPPFSFAIDEEGPGNLGERPWESIVFDRPAPAPHWGNYVKGAVSFARWKYGPSITRGFDFLIESSIPPNSGASSSSALVTLAGRVVHRYARRRARSSGDLFGHARQRRLYLALGSTHRTDSNARSPLPLAHILFSRGRQRTRIDAGIQRARGRFAPDTPDAPTGPEGAQGPGYNNSR